MKQERIQIARIKEVTGEHVSEFVTIHQEEQNETWTVSLYGVRAAIVTSRRKALQIAKALVPIAAEFIEKGKSVIPPRYRPIPSVEHLKRWSR